MQKKSEELAGRRTVREGVRKEIVDADSAGQRIDNYLRRILPGVPKSRIYRILRRGEVRVNGGRVRAEYKLKSGDEVRIPPVRVSSTPVPPDAARAAELLDAIIFEDKGLLVINKPGGLAVHGGSGISHGVIELLRRSRPDLRELALVHRLDRETSGCLVLAKKRSVLRKLHELFRSGGVEKNYLALVAGDWQFGEIRIDEALAVRNRRQGERHVVASESGKSACTRVRLSRSYRVASLLQCMPETGRTHQIRVHLASAGHPILGDDRYGDAQLNDAARRAGLQRLFLHAQSISFPDDSGNELHFSAPLADDLDVFLKSGLKQFAAGRPRKRR